MQLECGSSEYFGRGKGGGTVLSTVSNYMTTRRSHAFFFFLWRIKVPKVSYTNQVVSIFWDEKEKAEERGGGGENLSGHIEFVWPWELVYRKIPVLGPFFSDLQKLQLWVQKDFHPFSYKIHSLN